MRNEDRHPDDGLDERCKSDLRKLINCDTSPCEIPWVDFLAVGVSVHAGRKIGWIAINTSHQKLLELAVSKRGRPTKHLWQRPYSDRATYVRNILVVANLSAAGNSQWLDCPIPTDLNLLSSDSPRDTCGKTVAKKPAAGQRRETRQLITWSTGHLSPDESAQPENSLIHFETFRDLLETMLGAVRYYFGSGWFPYARDFLSGLSFQIISGTDKGMFIRSGGRSYAPEIFAGIGMGRLAECGWLPPNWNLLERLLKSPSDVDKYPIRRLRQLDEQGIRIFQLPSLRFVEETCVELDNKKLLQERNRLIFGSGHPANRALLAIEFTNHGRRRNSKGRDEESMADEKIYLCRFPIGVVSILRGFFSITENLVIAYSQAASPTTRSAVLERLIKLHRLTPNDSELESSIKRETRSLIHSSIPRPELRTSHGCLPRKAAHFELCNELDKQIALAIAEERSPPESPFTSRDSTSSNTLENIIAQAETANSSLEDGLSASLELGSDLLSLGGDDKELLTDSESCKHSERTARNVYTHLRQSVRNNRESLNNIDISSGSRSRPLTLFLNITRLMRQIVRRKLSVPTGLQEWVAQRFRLVWLMPLDQINALETCIRPSGAVSSRNELFLEEAEDALNPLRVYPGSKLATLVYPRLFSAESNQSSIKVDLSEFFDFCRDLSLDPKSRERPSWLREKIIETIGLLAGLHKKIGYCSDFELVGLLVDESRDEKTIRCMELLSTQTMLRSIITHTDGEEMLKEWSGALAKKCEEYFSEYRRQRKSNEYTDFPQLDVFLDFLGLAGAAIDCYRGKILEQGRDGKLSYDIHFLPHRLTKHFISPMRGSSRGTIGHNDNQQGNGDSREVGIDNVEIRLASYFALTPFPEKEAVELLQDWYAKEGMDVGETVEDLLLDLNEALHEVAGAHEGYKKNRNILLKAYYDDLKTIP